MEPNKFPNLLLSIQRFASGSCQFFCLPFSLGKRKLETDIRTLDSASLPCTTTVISLQNSFSRFMMISVGTPYRQIHLVKIAFATVSAVLSEMPTNSAYFETASVKLKMYLLLLPEATGAAIMSKFTR